MDWNDTLTLLIAVDTLLNAKLLIGAWLVTRWWRKRHAKAAERDALGTARESEAPSDADERSDAR